MVFFFIEKKCICKFFGKIFEVIDMLNFIEVQCFLYEYFFQMYILQVEWIDDGFGGVFKFVFLIVDFNEWVLLEYVFYEFELLKFDIEECM